MKQFLATLVLAAFAATATANPKPPATPASAPAKAAPAPSKAASAPSKAEAKPAVKKQ